MFLILIYSQIINPESGYEKLSTLSLITYAREGLCTVLLSIFHRGIEVLRDVARHRHPLQKLAELWLRRLAEVTSEVIGHDNHEAFKRIVEKAIIKVNTNLLELILSTTKRSMFLFWN